MGIIFGTLLTICGIVLVFMGGLIVGNGDDGGALISFFSSFLVAFGIFFIVLDVEQNSYKEGQVDALSESNIKYELKLQSDSSRIWVEKNVNR